MRDHGPIEVAVPPVRRVIGLLAALVALAILAGLLPPSGMVLGSALLLVALALLV